VTTDQALDHPVNRMTISQLLDTFCICFNMRAWKAESPAKDYLKSNSEQTARFSVKG
jgi:hypothetical protein